MKEREREERERQVQANHLLGGDRNSGHVERAGELDGWNVPVTQGIVVIQELRRRS